MFNELIKKALLISGVFLFLFSIFNKQAFAVPQLLITSVFVDSEEEIITINGQNFDNGSTAVVTLGEIVLVVSSSSSNEIIVEFPDAGIDPGDYLLTVSTGSSTRKNDSYSLTIGTVGPQGPPGEQGPPGLIDPSKIYISECAPPFATGYCQCEQEGEIALSASVGCGELGEVLYYVQRWPDDDEPLRAWTALCKDLSSNEYPAPQYFSVTCLKP